MQYVLTAKDFITGLSPSEEFGSLWIDQQGIDPEMIKSDVTYERFNVGVLRAGRTRTDLATGVVSALPTRVAKYTAVSGDLLMFVGTTGGYRLDSGNSLGGGQNVISAFTFVSGAYTGTNGIGFLSSINGGQFYVSMRLSAGNDRLIQLDTPTGATVTVADAGTSAFNTSNKPHPSFLKNNVLWWGDGSQIAKLPADGSIGALSAGLNVLDIPQNWTIQSISEHDKYLAFGATNGDSIYTTSSRLFLWDMLSDSWNYDFPLDGAITQLINDSGDLFIYTSNGENFSIYQFNGERIVPLNKHRIGGLTSQYIPFHTDSVALLDGKQYISVKRRDANTNVYLEIMALGSYLTNTENLTSPILVLSGNSAAKSAGAIEFGSYNQLYSCWQDTGGYAISKLTDRGKAGAEGTTIDLDSYFGGSGALKKLNWIRLEFNPLITGDQLDLYHFIDYPSDASSVRIDNETNAGIGNSIRYSDLGTVATKTFMINKQFRHYKLRLKFVTGNVRITKIVVDYEYIRKGQ